MTGKIRKVVIAAAGRGTRMLELSKDKPKHLIEVLGKPFLFYVLQNLKKAGVEEIIIVVGYQKQAMEDFAEKYKDEFHIKLIDQFANFGEEKYGTAVPIETVENILSNESFLAIYGDNLYSPRDVARFLSLENGYHYIGVLKHKEPQKYGVALIDKDEFLIKIVEKPESFVSDLINTGIYKFTPEIFNEVKKVTVSKRGEYELTDAIQSLALQKKVKALRLEDYWLDFGKPEDIPRVENFLRNEKE